MAGEIFDPERLRKRWTAKDHSAAVVNTVHPKLKGVVAKVDGVADARLLFQGIRERVVRDLPERQKTLLPFLDEAEQALKQLAETLAETRDPAERGERAEVALEVLWRLEDLLEAYYFIVK